MRIAIVTGEYPPMQGGVGDYSRLIGQALGQLGHDVTVFTSAPAVAGDDGGVTVTPIASRAWGWADVRRVVRAVADFDVVNIQYQAAAYGKMRPPIHFLPGWVKPPAVMTFHDLRVPYLFPKAGPLRWQAVIGMARAADGVIVTNPEDYQTLERDGRVRALVDIPIGSNIDPTPPAGYSAADWRATHGVAAGDWLLGYFGFLNPSKGGKTLVRTLAQLLDAGYPARLVLIGGKAGTSDAGTNTDYGDEVDMLAQELGVAGRVFRTGFLPPAETSAALLSTDVMVMPYRDGASFRRGTFMACLNHGKATVTTQPAVPLRQLRHGENIWLVQPDDPAETAAAVNQLMGDAGLRARIGAGAAALADAFTWDKIAMQQSAFFEQVLVG